MSKKRLCDDCNGHFLGNKIYATIYGKPIIKVNICYLCHLKRMLGHRNFALEQTFNVKEKQKLDKFVSLARENVLKNKDKFDEQTVKDYLPKEAV